MNGPSWRRGIGSTPSENVYVAALRQVNGDTNTAEDVAQSVTDLARKAGKLQHHGSIAGWLCASTRFAAANAVRGETRRRTREQEVVAMNEINAKEPGGRMNCDR